MGWVFIFWDCSEGHRHPHRVCLHRRHRPDHRRAAAWNVHAAAGDIDAATGTACAAILVTTAAALDHLAHQDFGVLLGRDPENLAGFLAFGSDGHDEFDLQRKASLQIPVVLPFHRTAVQNPPFEVGDVGQKDDFRKRFIVECRGRSRGGCGGIFENLVLVIPEDDVEVAAALFHGADLHGLGDAGLTAPGETERDILEREVGKVVGSGIADLEVETGISRQGGEALAQEVEKRLMEHFLVLRFDDRLAECQRRAGGVEHHPDDDGHEPDGDHQLKQGESGSAGSVRMSGHGWYIRP